MNIYVQLTREFNEGRLRAVLAGGQAVVCHRLAIMSKDGDWILREDDEALTHVRGVLERHGAHYRFGAPLDVRWMVGGWSAHFEFTWRHMRVRADFVTRPPRLSRTAVERMWATHSGQDVPFVGAPDLAELKKTNREKDYAVIGELARRMPSIDDQILYSRSARDLVGLATLHPERIRGLSARRPLLSVIPEGLARLEAALDAERRAMMHANEARLQAYMDAAERWAEEWPAVVHAMKGMGICDAHAVMVERANGVLPCVLPVSLA